MSTGAPQLGAGLFHLIEEERAHAHPDLFEVGSMLSYDERLVLHWATRAGNPSGDAVVDAGCFLGGSTVSLAGGVLARESGRISPVHVYDLFEFAEEWERTWVPDGFRFGLREPTRDIFEHHVRRVRPLLHLHPGDIRHARWTDGPVGVLFVDIAKAWDTGDAVWREFFPALVPGESLVIQQDLVHWGHPWCAIIMELLADHFELLGWAWYSSAVYRCVRAISPSDIPTRLRHELSTDEMLRLIERAAARMGEPIAGSIRLSGAYVYGSHGNISGARGRLDEVRSAYSDDVIPYISEGYAHVEAWISALEAGRIQIRG